MGEDLTAPESWPYLRLPLPEGADDEAAACVCQAAVEAGALGSTIERKNLESFMDLYLDPALDAEAAGALRRAVENEAARLGWPPLDWQVSSLPDAPWATAWKTDFKTTPMGKHLLIRPDWETDTAPEEAAWAERHTIWLRPGLGFGTGRHETTRLALETLERHVRPGMTVLDFGSGSGVLSIAAAALGAERVFAVEFDSQANENARDNLTFNVGADRITLIEADTPEVVPQKVDLVICNMLPHETLHLVTGLVKCLRNAGSTLIYSGFLTDQKKGIEQALTGAGLTWVEDAQLNEWAVWVGRRG